MPLPPPPECWDYRLTPPHLDLSGLRTKHRLSWTLGEHSTNWASSPVLGFFCSWKLAVMCKQACFWYRLQSWRDSHAKNCHLPHDEVRSTAGCLTTELSQRHSKSYQPQHRDKISEGCSFCPKYIILNPLLFLGLISSARVQGGKEENRYKAAWAAKSDLLG